MAVIALAIPQEEHLSRGHVNVLKEHRSEILFVRSAKRELERFKRIKLLIVRQTKIDARLPVQSFREVLHDCPGRKVTQRASAWSPVA
jgi:hypothetical protein